MYVSDGRRRGATAGKAVGTASTTWDLAEGSTQDGFEEYVLVANPTTDTVNVDITWSTPSGVRAGPSAAVAPGSRATFTANDTIAGEPSLSALVSASGPVTVERAVYVTSGPLAPAAT